MKITLITAATRPNARSYWVRDSVKKTILENYPDIKLTLVSPGDFDLKFDDDHDQRYSEIIKNTEGFIIVSSEYNHGYPGKLKTLLDSEFDLYLDKPVLIVGVSDGPFGGARCAVQLAEVLRTLKMRTISKDVLVRKVLEKYDENGNLKDEGLIDYIKKGIDELIRVYKTIL